MSDACENQPDVFAPLLSRRDVRLGILFWLLFAISAIAIRGVQWDEQYEFAQVINGAVAYPPDHPYVYCTWNALNLQIYLTALIYKLAPDPAIVCGFRNVLYLAMTIIPVFLLGAALSGRALWGHAAAILSLLGVHEAFDGCYQMWAWPSYASTGHVGMGYSILILSLLIGRCCRSAFFLLGLMPCIHIGQMPIPLAVTALFIAHEWSKSIVFRGSGSGCVCATGGGVVSATDTTIHKRAICRSLIFLLIGLAICAVVYSIRHAVEVPLPHSGVYHSTANPHAVWAGFVVSDGLRALPNQPTKYTNSFLLLGISLLLTANAAWLERRSGHRANYLYAAAYIALTAAAVWGVMLIHYMLQGDTPYVFLAWMPYRMANHAAIILVAALPAIVSTSAGGTLALAAALAFGAARPLFEIFLPSTIYVRYIAEGDAILFFLCAAAAVGLLLRSKRYWLLPHIVVLCVIVATHQFGLACIAVGAVFAVITFSFAKKPPAPQTMRRIAVALCAATLPALLTVQWQHRNHLPISDFERQLVQRLAKDGQEKAMLLAPPTQYTLQAKTGHPVMADTCLAPWIPYLPSIGPSIQKIHFDWYGRRWDTPTADDGWTELWRTRKPTDWQWLSGEYGCKYVICPNTIPLTLPRLIEGARNSLYCIPNP